MQGLDLADVMELEHHIENRNRFPAEELEKSRGQWVAWSLDDTRNLAHAEDLDALFAAMRDAGEDPQRCVLGGIPDAGAMLGWGTSMELAGAAAGEAKPDPLTGFWVGEGSDGSAGEVSRSHTEDPAARLSLRRPSSPLPPNPPDPSD
ncbi:MAG TPA: hypothetical protein VFF52_25310 [Isosphaeraceae bacterium]|nr:hypothetical protein [Isosphaeraceae bacterium]